MSDFRPYLDDEGKFHFSPTGCLVNIHSAELCAGRHCVVHNPSNHSMVDFPLHWRQCLPIMDVKYSHFERICPHGIGHPDPDDMEYWNEIGEGYMGVHGCDGCCT